MKLKDKKGLTLVEMLCTVAILVLVSMVMVLGVQLGVRSYAKSVSYSEAQVLCSTLTTTISDELRYSGTLKVRRQRQRYGLFSASSSAAAITPRLPLRRKGMCSLAARTFCPQRRTPTVLKLR